MPRAPVRLLACLIGCLLGCLGPGQPGPQASAQPGSLTSPTSPSEDPRPAGGTAPVSGSASAVVARRADQTLDIEITSVTPSALRPGGRLDVTGTVANVDDQVWREVKAYLVISPSPLTSRAELAAEAESPPESYIGDRILALGSFSRLGRLEVGAVADFSLDVPWATLPISGVEGVYTVGVQILATDADGNRDTTQALARARTFVPLVDSAPRDLLPRVDVGLAWPLRQRLLRRADGTYVQAERLRASLELGGRLRRMVDLASTAGDVPLSLVVDPALLDAADDIAEGRFGPPEPRSGGQDPEVEEEVGTADAGGTIDEPSPQARDWIDDVVGLFGAAGWVTRYGEPDPVVVADLATPRLRGAIARAGRASADAVLGDVPPTLAIPDPDAVDPHTLASLGDTRSDQVAVLPPDRLADWVPSQGVGLGLPTAADDDLRVLVADPALAEGGPRHDEPGSALQMRQRLLAETALLAIEADASVEDAAREALFVAPPDWDPGPSWSASDFFDGLDVPWLRPTPISTLLSTVTPYTGEIGDPVETAGQAAADPVLGADLVDVSINLARRAQTLARLVGGDRALVDWYSAAAALGVSSYGMDDGPSRLTQTRRTAAGLLSDLGRVRLDGPSFVTLSSSRGRFGVSITNGLERPVTVGVRVTAVAGGFDFDTGGPVTVGPGQRQTVIVDTRVGENRVTSARAFLVTRQGERFGRQLDFSVRSSVVGVVIWVVVGAAALLLLLAIARRVVTRVARRSDGSGAAAKT